MMIVKEREHEVNITFSTYEHRWRFSVDGKEEMAQEIVHYGDFVSRVYVLCWLCVERKLNTHAE